MSFCEISLLDYYVVGIKQEHVSGCTISLTICSNLSFCAFKYFLQSHDMSSRCEETTFSGDHIEDVLMRLLLGVGGIHYSSIDRP